MGGVWKEREEGEETEREREREMPIFTCTVCMHYLIIQCTVFISGSRSRGGKRIVANPNPKGGHPILNIEKANCQGGGANQSQEGVKAPPHLP